MLLPKVLTIIFSVVALLIVVVLGWAAWNHRSSTSPTVADAEATSPIGPVAANRWLQGLRWLLAVVITLVPITHAYWVFLAESSDSFAQARTLDARSRRLADSRLKGWVIDRSGKLDHSLIRYRADRGAISREYPLGPAAVHLTGYSDFVFGSGGIEYGYRSVLDAPPTSTGPLSGSAEVGKDLAITIDSALQRELFEILQGTGKPSAAVVILLPENEVIAMASVPSFDPLVVRDEREWQRLIRQAELAPERSPLVNRALGRLVTGSPGFYYRPGSTFKLFVASVAVDSGITEERFTCRGEGFVAPGVSRPIRDYANEVHGTIGLEDAFRLSCNQYFAQLGLKLGRERLRAYTRRLGLSADPDDGLRTHDFWRLAQGKPVDFENIFSPPPSRLNLSTKATNYDIALQCFGQGYADLTVIQMAALVASVANKDGMVASLTLEPGAPKKTPGPFVSPSAAEKLRKMMQSVVESGTAAGAFSRARGHMTAGGKTGTADRDLIAYGPDDKPLVARIDAEGHPHYKHVAVTDSWFVGFAPADNPRIAFAFIVENGGAGAHSAAPAAVRLIESATALGVLKKD
ncbi:MAG TPA: penicillin-binding transpeptidase domain-containing protein [Blastocatellia bacterium]|nr:penicillin-binding transpeptidase domain-containing protein [Blastocatellia bacterium]